MQITVEYSAQLRVAAGRSAETVELPAGASLRELLRQLGEQHGERLATLLVNPDGDMHPWLMADCNGAMLKDAQSALEDGARVRLLSPISGG